MQDHIIDATRKGNLSRFINHSCRCELHVDVLHQRQILRPIKKLMLIVVDSSM